MQHVAAVLARKKVEEEIKSKKLQQIEEDRKMAEELQRQRMEREVRRGVITQYGGGCLGGRVTLFIRKETPFLLKDSACPAELPRWLSWQSICLYSTQNIAGSNLT